MVTHATVHKASAEFSKLIDTLLSTSDQRTRTVIKTRLCPPAFRASAFAPCLLAEPFGVTDGQLLYKASLAGLCLTGFSSTIDDLADKADKSYAVCAHIGCLLLSEAASIYATNLYNHHKFWPRWQRYLSEASEAERFLWRHTKAVVPYDMRDFQMLGMKSALLNTSIAYYADLSGSDEMVCSLEEGLMNLATGVQIIDDLFDWREDYEAKHFTFPIVFCEADVTSLVSVESRINSVECIAGVIQVATDYLHRGRQCFDTCGALQMLSFVTTLTDGLESARRHIEQCPSICHPTEDLSRINRIRRLISPRLAH